MQENQCPTMKISNDPEQPGSRVAACLAAIEREYRAGRSGLSGLAEVSKHQFITARMEGMQAGLDELVKVVGEDEANHLMAERLDQVPEVEVCHV